MECMHGVRRLLSAGLFAVMSSFAGNAWAIPFEEGDIFAATGSGLVSHYRDDGTFVQNLDTTNGGFTTGMAFDAAGSLYVTNFSANRLAVFDDGGNLTSADFAPGLATPESVVFDQAGDFYVGNLGNGIRKYDATGSFIGTVINTRVDFFDLTADQSTFRYGQEGSTVLTVSNDIPGTAGPVFATGLQQAFAMRILSDGGLLVADNGNIKRFDAAGTLAQAYDLAGVNGWFALNLDPDGTSFWSGSFNDGILRKFDISSGALLQTLDTGCGTQCLFGVAVAGEITVGGPGDGNGVPVPAPATILLLALGGMLLGVSAGKRRNRR